MDERLQQLIDKQDISDALMRYTRGIDRADPDLIRSAYHPDAIDNHGPFKGGPEEFITWAMKTVGTFEVSQHSMSNIQIELNGDRANVETYLHILHVFAKPRREEIIFTRLLDVFERRAGEWKIANRLVVIDYSTTRDCEAPYSDQVNYTRFGIGKDDPVYKHRWL